MSKQLTSSLAAVLSSAVLSSAILSSAALTTAALSGAVLVSGALMSACGGDDDAGTSCASDAECSFGTVCVDGGCVALQCGGVADCVDTNQSCISIEGSKVCAATECGCPACPQCPIGESCSELGSCTPDTVFPGGGGDDASGGAGTDDASGGDGTGDASGGAGADTGGGPGADCTTDGCAAGETCNDVTGECEVDAGGDGQACAACTGASDCPTSWQCNPTSGGKVCLPPCTSANDCDTGWTCQGGACTPAGFECKGCILNGCAEGFICDTIDGGCHAALPLCGQCDYDWQCGPGNACIKQATGGRACQPRCTVGGDQTCPATSTCGNDTDSGIDVCVSNGGACCYEASAELCGGGPAACTPPCSGGTPFCSAGTCVQCLTSDDCEGDGACAGGSCTATECPANKPYLLDGSCVTCVTSTDCTDGTCDPASHTCLSGECTDSDYPYPVELGGDIYCVQCSDDSHCDPGCTCDQQLFACSGECIVSGAVECSTNADCAGTSAQFDLYCHESGLCVDDNGECDGAVVKCPYGNKCISLLDLLFGGFQLPPEFGGGGTGGGTGIPGACGCTPTAPGSGDFSSPDCPAGIKCIENTGFGGTGSTWLCETASCEEILGNLFGLDPVLSAVICAL